MGGLDEPVLPPEWGGIGVGKSWGGAVMPLGGGVVGMNLGAVVELLQVGSGMGHEAR